MSLDGSPGDDYRALHVSAMAFEGQARQAYDEGRVEEGEQLTADAQDCWAEMGRIAETLSQEGVLDETVQDM